MKNLKIVSYLIIVLILSVQMGGFAINNDEAQTGYYENVLRNGMLWRGTCSISRGENSQIIFDGSTKAYTICDQLTLTLSLYKETGAGIWTCIWENTYSAYNDDILYSPQVSLTPGAGTYKVIAYHTASDGYTLESGESESLPLEIY